MTGEPLGPVRPHLAAAQAEGGVSPEQVAVIDTALRKVDHCDPAAVAAGEKLLTEAAGALGPKELGLVAARVVDAIDPDGVAPVDEREHAERRFFHLKHRADGAWVGDFRLTPVLGQKLQALLDPLMSPHPAHTTGEVVGMVWWWRRWIGGRGGSGVMMRSRRSWTGCCAAAICRSRVGSRPRW